MSISDLLVPNDYDLVSNSLTVVNLVVTGTTTIPKIYVTKNWNPMNTDSVTFNGNGILTIQFNTTALSAGGNSALLTINNNTVLSASLVDVILTTYQNIPAVYNDPLISGLEYGLPTPLVYNVANGMFQVLILNNGYNAMGAADSFQLNIKIQ
jgi:hypothetical protein